MSLRCWNRCFLIVATLGFATHAQAVVFEYAKQIHGVTFADCERQSSDLAQHVARLSGGVVKSVLCVKRPYHSFDIRVFVDAQKAPKLEMAVFAFNIIPTPSGDNAVNRGYLILDLESAYKRLDRCLAALPLLESTFAQQTGLEPASSQCVKENEFTFVAQVDGFGHTERHLYDLSIDLRNGTASEKIFEQVKSYLASNGLDAVYDGLASSYLKIKYYGASEIKLRAFDFSERNRFLTEPECEQALNQVSKILQDSMAFEVASLTCNLAESRAGQKSYTMTSVLDLTGRTNETIPLKVLTEGLYVSFAACEEARNGVSQSYCSASLDRQGNLRAYELNIVSED